MRIVKTTVVALFAFLLYSGSASAVVIVSGTSTATFTTVGNLSPSFTYNLQGSGNTLVLATYVDAANPVYSNVLFDGNGPNGFIQTLRSLLAYYYNPDPSVNISFTVSEGNVTSGYYLYELSNVNTSIAADLASTALTNTPSNTGSITTTSDNRFIVDFVGNNNNVGTTLAPAAGSKITSYSVLDWNGGGGGASIGTGTGLAGLAGVQTLGWTGGAALTGEVSAAFVAAAGGPIPWNVNGGGNWGTGTNWLGNRPPPREARPSWGTL